jgi:hypothetical protein
VNRLKGELLLVARSRGSARQRHALSIRSALHNDRAPKFGSCASLARLWHGQGRNAEARDALAPIYGWFTDDLDLPDLKDARAVLDELNPDIGKVEAAG